MDTQETFEVGDKVKHPKFGQGTVMLRSGAGETQKLVVKFGGEVGEKKLMVKFANLKKVQERPTLPAAPAAEAAPAPLAARRSAASPDDEEDEDVELEDDELEVDEDDDLGEDEEEE